MSNRVHKAQQRSKQHCGKPMDTWRNSNWDETTKRLRPARHWKCLQCGHYEREWYS